MVVQNCSTVTIARLHLKSQLWNFNEFFRSFAIRYRSVTFPIFPPNRTFSCRLFDNFPVSDTNVRFESPKSAKSRSGRADGERVMRAGRHISSNFTQGCSFCAPWPYQTEGGRDLTISHKITNFLPMSPTKWTRQCVISMRGVLSAKFKIYAQNICFL